MSLTEKIIELVPEISSRYQYTITLADVLRAMRKTQTHWYIRTDGTFFEWEMFTPGGNGHHGVQSSYITWNLTTDLDGQSPETKEFLEKILL